MEGVKRRSASGEDRKSLAAAYLLQSELALMKCLGLRDVGDVGLVVGTARTRRPKGPFERRPLLGFLFEQLAPFGPFGAELFGILAKHCF